MSFVKRIGGIIGLLFLCFTTQAQVTYHIPNNNASWGQFYWVYGWSLMGYTSMEYAEGDTSIDGTTYIKIKTDNGELRGCIRTDSANRVWRYENDSTDVLLYDFNASVGDTMYVQPPYSTDIQVIIDSISTITLNNGEIRKCLYPQSFGGPGGGGGYLNEEPLIWVEGMGSNTGLFNPTGGVINDAGWWLTCFTENDTIKYGDSCNLIILNVNNLSRQRSIIIYPSPSNGHFTIQLPKRLGRNSDLIIQNTLGQIIHQQQIASTNDLVEINLDATSGFYLITIRNGNNIYNTKLLIEK